MTKRAFALLIAALAALAVFSQDSSARSRHRHAGTPGNFDFYVLSLSWSPSFCESGGGRNDSDEQCNRGRPYAFVVHGLWPQFERGFPENCQRPAPRIDRELIRSMTDIMPAYGLILHEWKTHGTCSGLSAENYFKTVRSAAERVKIPARFQRLNSAITVSPDEVERAFIEANPGLGSDMISITCDSRLREVRVCMTKDLTFRSCGENERRACRNPRIAMPPVRGDL